MNTPEQMFKQSCRLHLSHAIHRYLMSNTSGRMDGYEKAQRHIELCTFYVAAVRGVDDLDMVRRGLESHEEDYQAVHDATQALTDHLDEVIGFPLEGQPDYDRLEPLFFEHFHRYAMEALGFGQAAALKAKVGVLDAITGNIRECRECHSTALTWDTHYKNGSGVPEGRLRTNEVTCLFVLGCDECSETLAVVRAEAIADVFNTITQPTADLEPSSAG